MNQSACSNLSPKYIELIRNVASMPRAHEAFRALLRLGPCIMDHDDPLVSGYYEDQFVLTLRTLRDFGEGTVGQQAEHIDALLMMSRYGLSPTRFPDWKHYTGLGKHATFEMDPERLVFWVRGHIEGALGPRFESSLDALAYAVTSICLGDLDWRADLRALYRSSFGSVFCGLGYRYCPQRGRVLCATSTQAHARGHRLGLWSETMKPIDMPIMAEREEGVAVYVCERILNTPALRNAVYKASRLSPEIPMTPKHASPLFGFLCN